MRDEFEDGKLGSLKDRSWEVEKVGRWELFELGIVGMRNVECGNKDSEDVVKVGEWQTKDEG